MAMTTPSKETFKSLPMAKKSNLSHGPRGNALHSLFPIVQCSVAKVLFEEKTRMNEVVSVT